MRLESEYPVNHMNVLFVHEVSWFNKVVYEMHDFAELLSLKGHHVRFLDFDEGKRRSTWKSTTTVESRAHQGSRVAVTTPPRFLPGIMGRLLGTFIQPWVFLRLVRQLKPDIVVTYAVPTSGWQIIRICKSKQIPVVARIIDVPHALRRTIFRPLIRWAERYVCKNANHLSSHNDVLLRYCIDQGANPNAASVIHPGIDSSRFFPDPPSLELQRALGLKSDDKVLLFMGTLFRFSGLYELIIELASLLRDNGSLKLLILGDGEDMDRIQSLFCTMQLQHQILTPGRVEYDNLANYLRLGDIALLPFNQEIVSNSALPGKVLQYLACGLPTISTQLDGLMSVVPPGNGVVYAKSLHEMTEIITQLLRNPQTLQRLSESTFPNVSQRFDWGVQIMLFEHLLLRVVVECSS